MSMRILSILSALLVLTSAASAEQATDETRYAIVSNAENSIRTADATLIRLLYLKELREWPNGVPARPVGRREGSTENQILLNEVLRMDRASLAQHWISLKQRTGQRKVRQTNTQEKTLLLLKHFPGAFSVLPLSIAQAEPELVVLLTIN